MSGDTPTMAEAMEDFLVHYKEIMDHNREHHPESNTDGVERDFDQMTAELRKLMELGIQDTPESWESIMAGFTLGVRAVHVAGVEGFTALMMGANSTDIPMLLAFHFAIAKRWQESGDTKVRDALAALEEL